MDENTAQQNINQNPEPAQVEVQIPDVPQEGNAAPEISPAEPNTSLNEVPDMSTPMGTMDVANLPIYHKTCEVLGLNPDTAATKDIDQIRSIIDWARNDSPTKDEVSVLSKIKWIKDRTAPLGNKMHHRTIYRYLSLSNQIRKLQSEMSILENNNG